MSAFPIQSAKSGVVIAPITVDITGVGPDTGEIDIGKNVVTLTSVVAATGVVTLNVSPQWRRGLMGIVFIGTPCVQDSAAVLATASTFVAAATSINLTTGAVVVTSAIALDADMTVHVTLGLVYRPDRKGFE